jgi:copper resistance protein C
MRKFSGVWLVIWVLATAVAHAHTHLTQSVPANGTEVPASPPNIVLKFSEATRLTALTLQGEKGAQQKLAPLPSTPAEELTVKAPQLTPGKYVVTWRAVGTDGHVMSGQLSFKVAAGAKS